MYVRIPATVKQQQQPFPNVRVFVCIWGGVCIGVYVCVRSRIVAA